MNTKNIKTNFFNPNIMGPFSYIQSMECNHAILAMKNNLSGKIIINDNEINFNNGIGYIEKDWGVSFPKSYIWCQGNDFQKSNASFMLSIADVSFKFFNFRGIICSLIVNDREFKFTTYNNAKIIKYNVSNGIIDINIKKSDYNLNIKSECESGNKLLAPVKGKMEKDIFESISSKILVTLKKEESIIFSDMSINCGIEIVKNCCNL